MTVALHSPMPPAHTGVADYTAGLLEHLRKRGRVELGSARADIDLYHLGNNPLHAGIYQSALSRPGVVVLHDAVLHHFMLGFLSQEQYIEEFIFNYGDWARNLAENLWSTRSRSASDHRYYQHPMLRRVCEASRAVIVHNPAAAAMVRSHAPRTPVIEIPMLFQPPAEPASGEVSTIRRKLGAGSRTFLAGVFGHLRESKRIMTVLRAWRRLDPQNAVLVLAGNSGSSDLTKAMEIFLDGKNVRRVPFMANRDFWRLAHSTDACINLRYPTAGETSAIGIAFMGIGKPVIATSAPEIERYPEASCVRIEAGLAEESQLVSVLRWFFRFPEHARAIGALAASHIAQHHSADRVADLYWQTLCEARS